MHSDCFWFAIRLPWLEVEKFIKTALSVARGQQRQHIAVMLCSRLGARVKHVQT